MIPKEYRSRDFALNFNYQTQNSTSRVKGITLLFVVYSNILLELVHDVLSLPDEKERYCLTTLVARTTKHLVFVVTGTTATLDNTPSECNIPHQAFER